ncbi:MAG TPA: response regulator transcription factor [Gaiellales bacterium]|nr:response regulator transcription factor [Gaiellales bacterium]
MIRILIVDDHAVVRSGLRLLLEREDDLEPVGEAGDGTRAVRLARELRPDVVLLDVVMPGPSGVDTAAEIRLESPDSRILMLSMQDDPSYVRQAFASGAAGYVLKDAADTELVEAIRKVFGGEQYVHPALGARLVAEPEKDAGPVDSLSDREREVLKLLALGHTNQEIARHLFVSVRTVEAHRAHILNKLRVSTRAELVRHAIDTGLLNE